MNKVCTKCNTEQSIEDFYLIRNKPGTVCKSCTKAYKKAVRATDKHKEYVKTYNKNWRQRNPDKIKAWYKANSRSSMLKSKYGIDTVKYNELLAKQDNCCAICKINKNELVKPLYVDHCHQTGAIRGLLCQKCNSAIGLLKDSVEVLYKAIDYLKK